MVFISSQVSGILLTAIAACLVCVSVTALIWCMWWERIKPFRKPRRRQSKIDMEYAVKFSYPRRLTQSGTGNGDANTDKTSGIVSITPCAPGVEPRSASVSMAANMANSPKPPVRTTSASRQSKALLHDHETHPRPEEITTTQGGEPQRKEDAGDAGMKKVEEVGVEKMKEDGDISKGLQHQVSAEFYDNISTGATINPVAVGDFVEHVKKMKEDSATFDDEWARLYDHRYMPQSFALLEANFKKNRYKNILPYDHTRVILELIDEDPHSDYVNASYIKSFTKERTYIASQGPNVTSISDFWRMIWQEQVETIIMATNLIDKGKIKCEKYWPDQGEELFFEDIVVTCEAEVHGIHDARRTLVIHKGDAVRCVDHFHFTRWPDKGVPRNVSVLLRFIEEVNRSRDDKTTPLLVHCSAGVGRTGVVIALDNEMERAKQTGFVDIFNFIRDMRNCRPQMVQTPEQYEFIHDAMLEYLVGHDTMIPRDRFLDHVNDLQAKPDEEGVTTTRLEQEFEILNKVCHEPPPDATNVGKMEENTCKNRYQNVLPRDTHRPLLVSYSNDSTTQYINATFCQGYKDRERIITTQMPLPWTVTDFLRLVYDYRISTIVMLNDIMDEDASSTYFEDGNPNIKEPFSVHVLDTVDSEHWTERTLELKHRKNTRIIQHFQFLSWKKVDSSEFYQTLLDFMNNVTSQLGGDTPVLVHCLNGVGRTGVFCVVKMCLDQLEVEDAVDVFQIVKALRNDNFQMIQSLEDYQLCYRILYHLMTMSQEETTLQSVPEFDVADIENEDRLSESVSTKTGDDDEDNDVDIDPNDYYAHSEDDLEDGKEEEEEDGEARFGDLEKPPSDDPQLIDFDDMSLTRL